MDPQALSMEELLATVQDLWTLIAAALVLFMQAGFCCLEAGTVRVKNSINVAIKNIIDMCCAITAFFIVGYVIMFGGNADGYGLFGWGAPFLNGQEDLMPFLFQATFCATAATIVSGAIAERCRFLPYLLMCIVIGVIIYPIFGHWVWGGGWLSGLGFFDFAGSAVVHMIGGAVGLAGIHALGAREGRFDENSKPQPIPASSMPMVALGVVILTVGWIGFNGGSAAFGAETATIVVNTLIAASLGSLMALLVSWSISGLARVELILNGTLGGLVAVTACANVVTPVSSMVIGIAGGVAVVLGTNLLEKFRLDDAVGAIPVHLVAGVVGILATAIFANAEVVPEGGRLQFLGIQALGAVVCIAWGYGVGLLFWWLIGRITPLRIGRSEERVGLNYSEHKVSDADAGFQAALMKAAAGQNIDQELERLSAGDSRHLVQALRLVLARTANNPSSNQQALATELNGMAEQLEQKLTALTKDGKETNAKFGDIRDYIERMVVYLDEHRQESSAVPLLIDLLKNLDQQVVHIAEQLQDNGAMSLKEIAQQLADISTHMKRSEAVD